MGGRKDMTTPRIIVHHCLMLILIRYLSACKFFRGTVSSLESKILYPDFVGLVQQFQVF